MKFNNHFTPDKASSTLPLVKRIVTDILSAGQELRELKAKRDSEDKENAEDSQYKQERLIRSIEELVSELEQVGCYFKDWNFDVGLVDFPAIIDDEEVFLCWKSDEPELSFYHSIQEGFAGRKPIPAQASGKN